MKSALKNPNDWQAAWWQRDERVMRFYPPADFDSIRPRTEPLSVEAILEWRRFLSPYVKDPAALAGMDALAKPGTLAVITGQQAGLALGPLYTIYKALDAVRTANAIQAQLEVRCVPIFWIASDDHDLSEIESVSWAGRDGGIHTHRNTHEPREYLSSCFNVPLPDDAAALLQKFVETTNDSAFRPQVLDVLTRALTNATYESQFLTLFCEWLLPMGIFPVVPRLGFIRSAAKRILKREVESFAETNASVQRIGSGIKELGVDPPLGRSGNELNFFIDIDGIRAKLVSVGESIEARVPDDSRKRLHTFTGQDLQALIEEQAWRFSPNAILRPLVQDATFPTAVYVGGSSELLYHAQLGELYPLFQVTRPQVHPRSNVTLIDPRTEKALAKLKLDPKEVASMNRDEVVHALAEAGASGSELDAIRKQLDEIAASVSAMDEQLRRMTSDTGVLRSSEKLRSSLEQSSVKLLERVEFHLSTRDSDRSAARDRILDTLFPDGELQERTLSILAPFLVQNGPGALKRLGERIGGNGGLNMIATSSLRD